MSAEKYWRAGVSPAFGACCYSTLDGSVTTAIQYASNESTTSNSFSMSTGLKVSPSAPGQGTVMVATLTVALSSFQTSAWPAPVETSFGALAPCGAWVMRRGARHSLPSMVSRAK